MFDFDIEVERYKGTKICSGENNLCLINSKETTVEFSSVRLGTLWMVHVGVKVNGN